MPGESDMSDLNKPKPFDMSKKEDLERWFREMENYLKCCNGLTFVDAGTDFKGREFALKGFQQLKDISLKRKPLRKETLITPKQLHDWYLEATKNLNPESFNKEAQKSFEELTDEQKYIDKYIANRITSRLSVIVSSNSNKIHQEIKRKIEDKISIWERVLKKADNKNRKECCETIIIVLQELLKELDKK